MAMCTRYNIMWHGSSVTCDRSVVFSGESGFPHKEKWPPRCNWNIESGVKHHSPTLHFIFYIFVSAVFVLNIATRFLGPRKLILIGSFICSGAYLLNAYVPGVAVLFISHGILYGKIQNVISYIFCSLFPLYWESMIFTGASFFSFGHCIVCLSIYDFWFRPLVSSNLTYLTNEMPLF